MLKNIARTLVNRLWLRRLPGPFTRDGNRGWLAHVPRFRALADDADHPGRSTLVIYEDGRPLRPGHTLHSELRERGQGRYSHWQDQVLFSTTDNSDPNTNGRTYRYSVSPWLFRRRGAGPQDAGSALPVNQRPRDTSAATIRDDVAYAIRVGKIYLSAMRSLSPSLRGRKVLEVGPGINYGCVMLLACHGAHPIVADRFLAAWQDDYHRRFYSLLRDEIRRAYAEADPAPLDDLLAAGGYPEGALTRYQSALEDLPAPDASIDFVFSNAVLEHLYDLDASFRQLHRITKPGCWGLHQVDFRDHRNFERPLEYLLMSDAEFRAEFERCHGECGNRYRPDEATAAFVRAGFEILSFEGNIFSSAAYRDDLLPRLALADNSPYRRLGRDDLRVISGFYRVRKPT